MITRKARFCALVGIGLVAAMTGSAWADDEADSISGAATVSRYDGQISNPGVTPSISPAFAAATASHVKVLIDFDNDGFDDLPDHQYRPIPSYYYDSLGVSLSNLDARSVDGQSWSHSPPIAAWHTGFDHAITTPYSFTFNAPVASFGLFIHDLESSLNVTLHTLSGNQFYTIATQGSANIGQFHGFASDANVITGIDFFSGDYHIIDDVQFGYVPEPGCACMALLGIAGLVVRRRARGQRSGGA